MIPTIGTVIFEGSTQAAGNGWGPCATAAYLVLQARRDMKAWRQLASQLRP